MPLMLDSLECDDLALTPTPGSPRPYIPTDNHDRLDSIQLSSDASGEISAIHSPRSFLDPPGEGLAELRSALNPPWLHGLTGTPPSLVPTLRTDQGIRWVEDALRKVERPPADVASHPDLARLSTGAAGLLSAGASPDPAASISSTSQLPRSAVIRTQLPSNHAPLESPSLLPSAAAMSPQSPFDRATASTGQRSTLEPHLPRPSTLASSKITAVSKVQPLRSGDASSEEEESWPMPETPFLTDDLWNQEASSRRALGETGYHSAGKADHHLAILPEVVRPLNQHHHTKSLGRGHGLIGQHRAKEGERRVGRCKMYNCDKGVGFLIDDRLDEVPYDVKIHWTDLYSDQEFKSLAKGELVEYTLNITPNGYAASYVTGPGGRPVMGAEQTIVQASRQTSYKLFKAGALPVKTYRSKWDSISAGLNESPEIGLPSRNLASQSRAVPPAAAKHFSDLPKNVASAVPTNTSAPPVKNIKVKLPSARSEKQGSELHTTSHFTSPPENLNVAPETSPFITTGRVLGQPSPILQFSTPSWASRQMSVSMMPTSGQLINGPPSSQTPLLGLSHATLTPASVESFDPLVLAGQLHPNLLSMRPSAVQIATPSDPTSAFFNNQLLNHSGASFSQREVQNFLVERQLLLQHQAALMNLFQNVNHPTSTGAPPNVHHNAPQNLPMKVHPSAVQQEQIPYGSLYDRIHAGFDTHSPFFGLLPPITLPSGKTVLGSHVNMDDTRPSRSSGIWRSPEISETKLETVASLRPNAQTFMPSAGDNRGIEAFKSDQSGKNLLDVARQADGAVYQVPGRRSVSDSAAIGTIGVKKPAGFAQQSKQNKNQASETTNTSTIFKQGTKQGGAKRVTFADHTTLTPSRRTVSHGELISLALGSNRSPPADSKLSGSDHEESAPLYQVDTKTQTPPMPKNDTATNEDARRPGDVTSVDIAMERLREAAAPRRFLAATDAVTKPVPHQEMVLSQTEEHGRHEKEDQENTRLRQSLITSSDIRPDRFNLSSVILKPPTYLLSS